MLRPLQRRDTPSFANNVFLTTVWSKKVIGKILVCSFPISGAASLIFVAEYICPKCGHFNPSARSLMQQGGSRRPDGGQNQQKIPPQPPAQTAGRRIPPNRIHKGRTQDVDEGNSTVEMDIDS